MAILATGFGRQVTALALVLLSGPALMAQSQWTDQNVTGRMLFEREWNSADHLTKQGDGLGPLRNDVSCVACHMQGGVGGGGPAEKNVEMLSLVSPVADPANKEPLADRINRMKFDKKQQASFRASVIQTHAGFRNADGIRPTIGLHRFGPNAEYARFRTDLLGRIDDVPKNVADGDPRPIESTPVVQIAFNDGVRIELSQRNTTALYGAGLIVSISESLLRRVEREQHEAGQVSGRIAPTPKGPGRFGWRGQVSQLSDFVMAACANELGLQVPGHKQPVNPLQPGYRAPGLDLDSEQCEKLISFVADLPAPRQILPESPNQRQLVERGQRLFDSVGCATCHIPNLGKVEGVYSDLLLHDMGTGLSDPVPAPPSRRIWKVSDVYYGPTHDVLVETPAAVTRQEWKTPPLWGVRDSAPYMHDGRAETLSEAILMHGGEGRASMTRFLALSIADQQALMAFLETFAAPRSSDSAATDGGVALAP